MLRHVLKRLHLLDESKRKRDTDDWCIYAVDTVEVHGASNLGLPDWRKIVTLVTRYRMNSFINQVHLKDFHIGIVR